METSSQLISEIAQNVTEVCPTLGLMVKSSETHKDPNYVHAPVSLFPTPFPRDLFECTLAYQPVVGRLLGGLVGDPDQYIHGILYDFSKNDQFMQKLLSISKEF